MVKLNSIVCSPATGAFREPSKLDNTSTLATFRKGPIANTVCQLALQASIPTFATAVFAGQASHNIGVYGVVMRNVVPLKFAQLFEFVPGHNVAHRRSVFPPLLRLVAPGSHRRPSKKRK